MSPTAKLARSLLGALVAAVLVFALCWRFDNKYTAPGPQPIGGILYVEEADLADGRVLFPLRDWAYYPGVLLDGADFAGGAPPEQYVFLGQYASYTAGKPGRSPHGQGSWHLRVQLPPGRAAYGILLPEVYGACRLYVNGECLLEMGQPEQPGYRSLLGQRYVSFEAAGEADIVVAAAGYGYITGGFTHPPAFGTATTVHRLATIWPLLRSAACAVAGVLGLMFLFIRLASGYRLGLLYFLLCLCFAGFGGAPLLRAVAPMAQQPLGAVYLGCYYAMFLLILVLQGQLYGLGARPRRWMALAGGLVCAVAVLLALLPAQQPWQLRLFSLVSEGYKWAMALLMLGLGVWAIWRGLRFSPTLLFAVAFFAFALLADRLLPMYEPILTGWFAETAGFVVLCVLGVVLWQDMARALREVAVYNQALETAEKRLVMMREHYRALDEQAGAMRAVQHDFRQQMILLQSHVDARDWDALAEFLADYRQSLPESRPIRYTENDTVNVITRYYAGLCAAGDIGFTAQYDLPADLPLPAADLSVVLGNLLENALEACRRQPGEGSYIRVVGTAQNGKLTLTVKNTGAMPAAQSDGFASAKVGGGQGMKSVRMVARRCDGDAMFNAAEGIFTATVVMRFSVTPAEE